MSRALIALGLALACSMAFGQVPPVVADGDAGSSYSASLEAASSAAAAAALTYERGTPAARAVDALSRIETGVASWYGTHFHGRKTASGEIFNMDDLTAAHPKLPFGSWVRVSNLADGRSVDVRINDRGPHIKQRVIDLSRAAAQALGLTAFGTRPVAISLIPEAEKPKKQKPVRPGAVREPREQE